jgi:hypothetical protein
MLQSTRRPERHEVWTPESRPINEGSAYVLPVGARMVVLEAPGVPELVGQALDVQETCIVAAVNLEPNMALFAQHDRVYAVFRRELRPATERDKTNYRQA